MKTRQPNATARATILALALATLLLVAAGSRLAGAQDLAVLLGATPTADQPPVFDYAILIDISGSMVGQGSDPTATDIFPNVQAAVESFIGQLPPGSRIVIMPFGAGVVQTDGPFTLTARQSRAAAIADVQNLPPKNPDGSPNFSGQTFLYTSAEQGLTQLATMRANDPRPHVQTELIYTDGLGNGPGDTSLSGFLSKLDAVRAEQPHLFVKYVSLGKEVPDSPTLQQHGVQVVTDPSGQVSPEREVRISPATIELGSITADGTLTTPITTSFSDPSVAGETLHLAIVPGSLPVGLTVDITPAEFGISAAPIALQLTIHGTASHIGWHQPKVKITSSDPNLLVVPETIVVHFTVAAPTPPPTATATATATATPTATATATPILTATATATPPPTATPSPTSTPRPTPTVGFSLGRFPIDLGTIRINPDNPGSGPVEWAKPVPFTSTSDGITIQAALPPQATNPLPLAVPQNLFFRQPGDPASHNQATLSSGVPVTLVARLDPKQLAHLGEGTHRFRAQLLVNPGAAMLAGSGFSRDADSRYIVPVTFAADVQRPPDYALWFTILGAFLLVVAAVSLLPRLPTNAYLDNGTNTIGLRAAQPHRSWLRQTLGLGGRVTLGGPEHGVNLGLDVPAATISSGRPGLRKHAVLRALSDTVEINQTPLAAGTQQPLRHNDEISLAGHVVTYREGDATDDEGEDDRWAGDEADETSAPPQRRWPWQLSETVAEDDEY